MHLHIKGVGLITTPGPEDDAVPAQLISLRALIIDSGISADGLTPATSVGYIKIRFTGGEGASDWLAHQKRCLASACLVVRAERARTGARPWQPLGGLGLAEDHGLCRGVSRQGGSEPCRGPPGGHGRIRAPGPRSMMSGAKACSADGHVTLHQTIDGQRLHLCAPTLILFPHLLRSALVP